MIAQATRADGEELGVARFGQVLQIGLGDDLQILGDHRVGRDQELGIGRDVEGQRGFRPFADGDAAFDQRFEIEFRHRDHRRALRSGDGFADDVLAVALGAGVGEIRGQHEAAGGVGRMAAVAGLGRPDALLSLFGEVFAVVRIVIEDHAGAARVGVVAEGGMTVREGGEGQLVAGLAAGIGDLDEIRILALMLLVAGAAGERPVMRLERGREDGAAHLDGPGNRAVRRRLLELADEIGQLRPRQGVGVGRIRAPFVAFEAFFVVGDGIGVGEGGLQPAQRAAVEGDVAVAAGLDFGMAGIDRAGVDQLRVDAAAHQEEQQPEADQGGDRGEAAAAAAQRAHGHAGRQLAAAGAVGERALLARTAGTFRAGADPAFLAAARAAFGQGAAGPFPVRAERAGPAGAGAAADPVLCRPFIGAGTMVETLQTRLHGAPVAKA